MPYLKALIQRQRSGLDDFEHVCQTLGSFSFSITPQYSHEEELKAAQPDWQNALIEVLFPHDLDARVLRKHTELHDAKIVELDFVGDKDWVENWRQELRPIRFGRLMVVPRDHVLEKPDEVVVRLDPGLAFGTGTHESTSLCIDWLVEHSVEGKTVLDAGCGSGILGIAAAKLGAARVVGVDIDIQALEATEENARINQVEIDVQEDFDIPIQFDVVLANILAEPLIQLASTFRRLLTPGGHLVLAGILESQVESMRAAYPFIEFEPVVTKGHWVRLAGVCHP